MMLDLKTRNTPYCWVTWITGLLAGTDKCHWKVWVKSHYYLPKKQEDSESQGRLNKWIEDHDDMVKVRALALRREGLLVFVEDENSFNLKGEVANLGGKPDILAVHNERKTVKIIDEKSGKPKEQYIWQVLIYMFAKSFVYTDFTISGELEYKNHTVSIHSRQLNTENKRRIGGVMKIVGGVAEPPRVPSKAECGYCDILDCPDRIKPSETDASAHF